MPEKGWTIVKQTPGVFLVYLAFTLLLATAAGGFEPSEDEPGREIQRFMLLRMEVPPGFHDTERAALESDFLNALLSTGTVQVVNRNDMQDIVNELKFQSTDMVDPDRAASLGRLMGATHFVALSVRAVHGQSQITARRIRVETGEVEKVVVRRSENRVDFLPSLLNDMAYDLAGAEGRKGSVRIESEPRAAEVLLFGIPAGESPVTLRLAPGPYLFTVKKAGHADRRKTVYVSSGEETVWTARLAKKQKTRLRDLVGGKSAWGTD